MYQTEEIKELVSALCKAQGKMEPAKFNKINPHFKNRYADFTSIMEACRTQLSDHGLSVMQYCETVSDKLYLVTMLAHVSGQWIKSLFPLNPRNMDSQSIGSAMTYAKRYSLSAILGIVSDDDDDDAETSYGRGSHLNKTKEEPKVSQKISASQVAILKVMDAKLSNDMREKVYSWMSKMFMFEKLEDVSLEVFPKIFSTFEGAVKSEQKVEVVNV